MKTILHTIADYTAMRINIAKKDVSLEKMKAHALSMNGNTGFPFEKALVKKNDVSFICECKKASPSKGIITEKFDYISIAKEYEAAGAACVSVLTEPHWFLGENRFLEEISKVVNIPCLRKDFAIDEYMLYEAKTLGASAVLLITTLLDVDTMREYINICDTLGLSALVEVHDEREVEIALRANARIIGVNNRNLKDFSVDIENSMRLRGYIPDNILFVAESGIKTAQDIKRLKDVNINGVLIGEVLMKAENKKEMLEILSGQLRHGV